MNSVTTFFLALFFLITAASLSFAALTQPDNPYDPAEKITKDNNNNGYGGGPGDYGAGMGGFFSPGAGFDIPGLGNGVIGGGYGGGYGGPNGGYSRGGIIRPTVVCREKGPCYKKKLACPAKCFRSYSRSGKGYGGGGGGGGCTMDCKKKCIAYC